MLFSLIMKRTLILLAGLVTVSAASAHGVGARVAYDKSFKADGPSGLSLGLQYAHSLDPLSTVRGTLDLSSNMGLEVAYLRKLPTQMSANLPANLYAGAALGITKGSMTANNSKIDKFIVKPSALAGGNFLLSPELNAYGELALGYAFVNTTTTVASKPTQTSSGNLFVSPRIGVTYTLR